MGRKSGKDESPEAGEGKNTVKATNAEKKLFVSPLLYISTEDVVKKKLTFNPQHPYLSINDEQILFTLNSLAKLGQSDWHCVKSVKTRSFFLVRIQENTDQK